MFEHSKLAKGATPWLIIQNYRVWIIWRCPPIRFLDYQKVKDVERDKATSLFGTFEQPSALASKVCIPLSPSQLTPLSISPLPLPLPHPFPSLPPPKIKTHLTPPQITGIKSHTFDIPSASLANGTTAAAGDKSYRVKLTEKEKKRVEGLIRNAKSLQEISRLEKELNDGRVPQGGGGDEMEE